MPNGIHSKRAVDSSYQLMEEPRDGQQEEIMYNAALDNSTSTVLEDADAAEAEAVVQSLVPPAPNQVASPGK